MQQQQGIDAQMGKEAVEDCLKENGVTGQDLLDLQTGKVKTEDAKDNVKCATQCILVKTNYMDSDGNLLVENIKKKLGNAPTAAAVEKNLERCAKIKGANACDKAFKVLACFHDPNMQG